MVRPVGVGRVRHPPMLQFRGRVHHPRHGGLRFRRELDRAGPARRRPSHRRPRALGECRGPRAGTAAGRLARPRRAPRIGDVTKPETLPRRTGRHRRRPPPRRDPARSPRRRGPALRQHRGHARRRRGDARRPASGASSTWARWASRTTRPSTTRARRRRPRRSSPRPGLDWTILKPSLQFGQGDGFFNIIADLVRLSPGRDPRARATARAGSSRSTSATSRRVVVASLADPTTVGGTFELGGPRYWTYREITREVLVGHGQAPRHRPDARAAHPARRRRPPRPLRIPFPVATDQLRQLRLDNIGPLDVIPTALRVRAATDGGRARLPPREGPRPADPRRRVR